jgi:hypothetical protein
MVDQARAEDNRKLKEENARLNMEMGNLLNENRATWVQAEAAAASAERIREFLQLAYFYFYFYLYFLYLYPL